MSDRRGLVPGPATSIAFTGLATVIAFTGIGLGAPTPTPPDTTDQPDRQRMSESSVVTAAQEPFSVHETGILELGDALASGRVTSVDLVNAYRARIEAYDRRGPTLNSVIRLNPDARRQAAELDREREAGRVRGPLHGVPVVVKDNYDVAGMPTSAATIALAGLMPPDDAFQVRRLREAGAIILAKTNLHELASGITTVSSLGGQTRNPYDPRRNPGGSSGGTGAAVAASLAAVGWGSDTCGSIRIPSALNNLFGLRPTKGLSSIDGLVPLAHSQDVAGPLARSVTDLALALDATVGYDPADPATELVRESPPPSFVEALDEGALAGVRIGALEPWLEDADPEVRRAVRDALDRMGAAGAEIVSVPFPDMDQALEGTSLIAAEFKFDLADYLSAVPDAPVDSLGAILELGLHHEALDGRLRAWNRTRAGDSEARRETVDRQAELRRSLEELLEGDDLDALAYPTIRREAAIIGQPAEGSSCALSARSGLPAISVPAGFTADGAPVGLELLGSSLSDHDLVAMAFAYERAVSPRRPPFRTPPLENGRTPEPRVVAVVGSAAESPDLVATFTVDVVNGRVTYDVAAPTTDPSDVHAVTLERRSGDVAPAIVDLLARPGTAARTGSLALTPSLHRDLTSGRLAVGLYTADAPRGLLRLPLSFDSDTQNP